ncbi:glycosyltransferase family 25 protein [Pseudoalteromonas sp. NEC-BIFX-2020_002]|uniref:glycosyltransferase family 25 protein n=1 Tax=Pseudoalteromonas sp. NEC-BIFX-2020_002 TaxID=2732353 RepID=UPI001476FC9F|nr:glycosyltransferase family 25 protein [Pseudoalteromonas sp. NEC-BIFX-2020_002]NNG44515.1 glycosyltransferase family 25 protein [Pseudoalteromonas sp. NEC-BIFX-2020_002]
MTAPIYIINMPSCKERWHTTASRLEHIGLKAQRFTATVGKTLTPKERALWYCPKKNKQHYHRDLTPGEIGCYVSHMRLWQKMVDENILTCVVLEDDLLIEEHLKSIIKVTEELKDWDLIKLSNNRAIPFIDTLSLTHNLVLGNYLKVPNGTLGYILSLEGAKKLLNRKPFYRPVDMDIQFHSEVGLKVVGIKPYPVAEDEHFESEIALANSGSHSSRSTFIRNLKHRICIYLQRKKISADISTVLK